MIQNSVHKAKVSHECYDGEDIKAMPLDRMPSLTKIVAMFTQGRPIDASLQRHLDYNDLERNPVLEKGFDLADYSRVAKRNKATLDQINEEVEQAMLARKTKADQVTDPTVTPPEPVVAE